MNTTPVVPLSFVSRLIVNVVKISELVGPCVLGNFIELVKDASNAGSKKPSDVWVIVLALVSDVIFRMGKANFGLVWISDIERNASFCCQSLSHV